MKVFVSGCFDLLHSGHVAFLREASTWGELYVGIGSDETVRALKGRYPVCPEKERLFMVQSLRFVKEAWINSGSGHLDFETEVRNLKPDLFFVNADGFSEEKRGFCEKEQIKWRVGDRIPVEGLPSRSSSFLRPVCQIPYRVDLAGGWLDQPFVSQYGAGPVLTLSIEPDHLFAERSGMAGSTRQKAIELWHDSLPSDDPETLAKKLFEQEKQLQTPYSPGSQDAIGIVYSGLNRLDYGPGEDWPHRITHRADEALLQWIESCLQFVPLSPRKAGFDPLKDSVVEHSQVAQLSAAANGCWDALLEKDLAGFGHHLRASFEAQVTMFPHMVNDEIRSAIGKLSGAALGWKLSGAGGGGYLVLVSDHKIDNAFRVRIRR
ncbi:MAG: adenylyltransferase/cytidyltransferase family protein [Marinilabiliales bacterium]|nr:adenylyltransferase/cytidyltransferase family protein [Marinilabiliales bacterium]